MELAKTIMKNLLFTSVSKSNVFKRNVLKEYLQILVLDYIYSHPEYSRIVFYGGSCLAHCFGLPRLSEDLDFVDIEKKIKLSELAKDLEKFFLKEIDFKIKVVVQKFRIYLKFPVLKELGLAKEGESDLLFLKVEVFREFDFCKGYKIEMVPLFKFNKSMLIRTFDLSTLMSTKLGAILLRKWEKIDKAGKSVLKVRGRDYFDFMWYLERHEKPNIKCIKGIKTINELKEKTLEIIEKVDAKSIQLDLEALIEDQEFIKRLSNNLKSILRKGIREI